jgi:hypothetical protein
MLLFSLSDTPRNKRLEWYEDVCAQARGLCAAFDPAGALSMVAYPKQRMECIPGEHHWRPAEFSSSPYLRSTRGSSRRCSGGSASSAQKGHGQTLRLYYG